MGRSHQGLRVLAGVFLVVAWLVAVIGLLGAVGVFLGGAAGTPRAMGAVVLAVGALYFCVFSAFSGILRILLTIEEQTRKSPPIS